MNTRERLLRGLAIILVLTVVGIGAFWTQWFLTGSHLSATPECYRIFENTFPLPDALLAALLLATAGLLWQRKMAVLYFGGLAGGMLLYLAALDGLYNLQHTQFAFDAEPPGMVMLPLVLYLLVLAGTLFTALLLARDAVTDEDAPLPAPGAMAGLTMLAAIYAAITAAYWIYHFAQSAPDNAQPCLAAFHQAFYLADATTLVTLSLALAGSMRGRRWGLPFATSTCGGILFGTMNYTLFALQNPTRIDGNETAYVLLILLFLTAIGYALVTLWRNRGFWLMGEGAWRIDML
ncbi:MAG: hypothetical protein ACLFTT_14950 [Candidatus Hydrogenedentota bacterium]